MTELHPANPAARLSYHGGGLEAVAEGAAVTPWDLVHAWWTEAVADERVYEPGAMSLATVDGDGLPNVRAVLLKDLTPSGLTFYTNLESAKSLELTDHPQAALLFPWVAAFRQMRFRGEVEQVTRAETEQYWQTRPRGSQVASAASRQSSPLESREALEASVADMESACADTDVPLPPTWGGFRIRPVEIELWVGMRSRLHDRIQWRTADARPARLDDDAAWNWTRLQP